MRKTRSLTAVLLAAIFSLSFITTCTFAKSMEGRRSDLQHYIKLEAYTITHPKEVNEIERSLIEGRTDLLNQYIPDPEDQEYYLKTENLSTAISHILKTALITINPENTEHYMVPVARIGTASPDFPVRSASFLTMPNNSGNRISIDFFLIYQTNREELVLLGILRNQSQNRVEVKGISEIELTADGEKIASGIPSSFETPIKLAPYQAQLNTGVYDGLPTTCFVKLTFAPGNYNSSIDISNLDNVSCRYSLDYSIIP